MIKRDNKKKRALVNWSGYSDEHNFWFLLVYIYN